MMLLVKKKIADTSLARLKAERGARGGPFACDDHKRALPSRSSLTSAYCLPDCCLHRTPRSQTRFATMTVAFVARGVVGCLFSFNHVIGVFYEK